MLFTSILGLLVAGATAHPTVRDAVLDQRYQMAFTTDGTGDDACFHAVRLNHDAIFGSNIIIADPDIPLETTEGNLITINATNNILFHEPLPSFERLGGASVFYPNLSPSSPASASYVSVTQGYPGDSGWSINVLENGHDIGIFHDLHAGSQGLFACQATIEGKNVSVLSFGKYGGNLEFPADCKGTRVVGLAV